MAKASTTKTEEKKEIVITPQDTLQKSLDAYKDDHYNDTDEVEIPLVSSGSLLLDIRLGGGFSPGLIRLVGHTEGGKTSETLEVIRNFLLTVPNARAVLVKAEGRLSKEMRERSGVKFVWKTAEWVAGTCFVLETNVYDLVLKVMRDLVKDNPQGYRYCFALDSMDGLILKSDMDKEFTENMKVAGAPALTKKFLQRLATSMNKFGHVCIMIGQVSSKIEIDTSGGAPKEVRQISATGGNAALHFANWILQFEPRFIIHMILEKPKERPDPQTNKMLGHWCRVMIKKSPNESSGYPVEYPIKYGRAGGQSIWREFEIVIVLKDFNMVTEKGSWINIDPGLVKLVKDGTGEDMKSPIQGEAQFKDYLEANPKITDFLFNHLKAIMIVKDHGKV